MTDSHVTYSILKLTGSNSLQRLNRFNRIVSATVPDSIAAVIERGVDELYTHIHLHLPSRTAAICRVYTVFYSLHCFDESVYMRRRLYDNQKLVSRTLAD